MTGDAPQPGETPRDDGTPWSSADPASPWWRPEEQSSAAAEQSAATDPRGKPRPQAATVATPTLDPPRPGRHTGEAAGAHQAAVEDTERAITVENTERAITAEDTERAITAEDTERAITEDEGTVYVAASATEPANPDPSSDQPTTEDRPRGGAGAEEVPRGAETPEVMVLPEPDRTRPTVALDRTALPGQPPSGPSRFDRAQRDGARADRALQDRVRQERTAALLETSPFWKAEEERRAQSRTPAAGTGQPPRRRAPQPRRPATGLFALLALGLVATFFAWVSAEPFWLAVGHGDQGSATVTRCTGSGVSQRCTGQFTAANGTYRVDGLALYGVEPGQHAPGASAPARMVSSESRQAYVGGTGPLMHLRWTLSFVLVLLCGLGIAGLTGARQLAPARARRGVLLVSLAGPLVLLAGFLGIAY